MLKQVFVFKESIIAGKIEFGPETIEGKEKSGENLKRKFPEL